MFSAAFSVISRPPDWPSWRFEVRRGHEAMGLRIFQSGKSDCLLLQGVDGKNVLRDGGMTFTIS